MFIVDYEGFNLNALEAEFRAWQKEILIEVHGVIEEVTLWAETRMIEILEKAFTETGLERAAKGQGEAGRVESSTMRDAIRSHITAIADAGGEGIQGEWGWLEELMDYFLDQEYGADLNNGGHIGAMGALQQSFTEAEQMLIERLRDLGLEMI